jgi:hypothetical protein
MCLYRTACVYTHKGELDNSPLHYAVSKACKQQLRVVVTLLVTTFYTHVITYYTQTHTHTHIRLQQLRATEKSLVHKKLVKGGSKKAVHFIVA